jgi:hypothetical protein
MEAEGLKPTQPAARGRGKKNPPKKPAAKKPEVSKPEALDDNKYAQKEKIGTPTLGRSPNYVTKVGLGGLTVIHNGDPGSYS